METLKELKSKILEKISEEELEEKYQEKCSTNQMFEFNKRAAYHLIAKDVGADLKKTVVRSGGDAFPLKIGEVASSEKTNFNLSGYLVKENGLHQIVNSKGNPMAFVEIADDTGIITVTVFKDGVSDFVNKDHSLKFNRFDYVTLKNLSWKDKTSYNPSYGGYSGVESAEPEFSLDEIQAHKMSGINYSSTRNDNFYKVKGMVYNISDDYDNEVAHCPVGHYFTDLKKENEGEEHVCSKCDENDSTGDGIREVMVSAVAEEVNIASEDGSVLVCSLPAFANVKELELNQTYLFSGEYGHKDDGDTGVFTIQDAYPLKKR